LVIFAFFGGGELQFFHFIKKVNRGGIRFLDRIITTDESWFHYYDPETKQQSSQWKNCNLLPWSSIQN
jgi:hypothetical protein